MSAKTRLGIMMFLQYAIWGAWAPVLSAYLLDDLGYPPAVDRAQTIVRENPYDIRIDGPSVSWSSDPDFPLDGVTYNYPIEIVDIDPRETKTVIQVLFDGGFKLVGGRRGDALHTCSFVISSHFYPLKQWGSPSGFGFFHPLSTPICRPRWMTSAVFADISSVWDGKSTSFWHSGHLSNGFDQCSGKCMRTCLFPTYLDNNR